MNEVNKTGKDEPAAMEAARKAQSVAIQAFQDALPIVSAYVPIAITFGVICTSHGIPWFVATLISLVVYAGAAQFMLVSFVLAGLSPWTTIVTLWLVNLRHFLYGTTLGPSFAPWPERLKWLIAFGLTDEVFAVTSHRLQSRDANPAYQLPFVYACYGSWVVGTVIGSAIGAAVSPSISSVLTFALPALFLALLCGSRRSNGEWTAAAFAALCAILAQRWHAGSAGILVGTVIGASIGMIAEDGWRKIRERRPAGAR